MTFRRLAFNNILGNKHRYTAFFLSSVFAVMVFFVYASFIFHPEIHGGHIIGSQAVAIGMIACEFIIIIFSFFFVLYSCSAFLKTRKKEFGLFMLFGFTKRQLRRMVLHENILIGLFSTAAGIGLGLLFNKLFFMLISDLARLEQPISFYWPMTAIVITAGSYITLFLLITLLSMHQAGRLEIRELMLASSQPKPLPKFSGWLVLLSLLSLGGGYALAYTLSFKNVLQLIIPITLLVVLGTYLLYTQSSIAILKRLQSSHKVYYKNTSMIIISQMMFKLRDNAWVLFLVSVLCAVILTASGFLNVMVNGNKAKIMEHYPQTIGFRETGLNTHQLVHPDAVQRILQENGETMAYEVKLVGLPLQATLPDMGHSIDGMAVSQSDYNALASRIKNMESVDTAYERSWWVYSAAETDTQFIQDNGQISFHINGQPLHAPLQGQLKGKIAETPSLLVLNDKQYAEIAAKVPDNLKLVTYGFELSNWESADKTIKEIARLVPGDRQSDFVSRTEAYAASRQMSSLFFFIAVFVSVLFFIASGSLLFFKLFTELEEDRQQLQALRRIGLTRGEMSRIITVQTAVLFYLPCVVGGIHAAFAMKATSNLLNTDVWLYSGIILLIYLALQTVYFLVARNSYVKKMLL